MVENSLLWKEGGLLYEIDVESSRLIEDAIHKQVTDIHFVPQKENCSIQYRILGQMNEQRRMTHHVAERLISHFKYMSGMDIGERRKPQSTAMTVQTKQGLYSLRLSTLPAQNMESLAIRLLPQKKRKSLQELPLIHTQSSKLQEMSHLQNGLVLICGPTSSGKTTTLYALAEEILCDQTRSVISIEDPVERSLDYAVQLEVNHRAGLTFESGLRSILRHDPDVILVGEIRDQETAALAVRASLTGHLVLASIHTTDAFQAILRFQEYGLSKVELAEVCRIIFAQRLVRTCFDQQQAIYEYMEGVALKSAVYSSKRPVYYQLKQTARKAWALGYVSEQVMKRMEEWD
ncbi:competence type IV pilus ATPase ComGA [Alkalicoccobacillus murimartini]|uniref:Competence protein ComGA n=1 Tax=Alkalicoccobacillus murimartini TaxID=171685 RepID=A0ABT9YNE4_9BACI|nr:competence type IV pilus ATPase ComGA [Alkalicoccobacillus murimartini]MDQ0209010.1 competence protein ComGA [Alkalicoccobacillus murimartini]